VTRLARSLGVRFATGAVALVATGSVVAACGASAGDLAQTSCNHVNKSISLLDKASHATNSAQASALRYQAYVQLVSAIPIAAYHNVQFESLSMTLAEANRVPEKTLIPSLQAQCHNVNASVFSQVPPTSSPASGNSG